VEFDETLTPVSDACLSRWNCTLVYVRISTGDVGCLPDENGKASALCSSKPSVYVLESDAPFVFESLARAGQPFLFFSATCGVGCLTLIASGITQGARALAVGAVVAVLASWGVAQYPYLLPTSLSIAEGTGAPATLRWVLFVSLIIGVTVVPTLALLFVLDRRGRLEETSQQRDLPVAAAEEGHPPGDRPDDWWSHVPSP